MLGLTDVVLQITLPGGVCGHCRCGGTRCSGCVCVLLMFCPGCTRDSSGIAWTGEWAVCGGLGWSPRDTALGEPAPIVRATAPNPAWISLHLSMWVVGVGVAGFTHVTDWITRETGRSHHPGWCSPWPCVSSRPVPTSVSHPDHGLHDDQPTHLSEPPGPASGVGVSALPNFENSHRCARLLIRPDFCVCDAGVVVDDCVNERRPGARLVIFSSW